MNPRPSCQFVKSRASWHRGRRCALGWELLLRVASCSLCFCAGCRGEDSTPQRPLSLVASGDTSGWIVPCGCTSNQSGGLLRRGSFLAGLRQQDDVLYVDVGGAPAGVSAYDRLKFEAILRGESAMGIVAHNIGAGEARLGAESLRALSAKSGVTLISCNLRDADGSLVADAMRSVDLATRRIALVGVLSEQTVVSGMQIDPPREAILATLKEHQPKYDALVVLAYLPADELLDLAANLPEADVIIGGPTGQSIAPQRSGPTWVASATNKGKFLAHFRLPVTAAQEWQGTVVEMATEYGDDSRQQDNLAKFYQTLSDADLTPAETSFVETLPANLPADFQIAGTESCRSCHAAEHSIWSESAHAHAAESLMPTGAHVDAYCQQCHTTGYGIAGGFVSTKRSPVHAAVGCESCHGPSQAHVREPRTRTAFASQARHQCQRCHDRENSPTFDFDSYWSQVRHGNAGRTEATLERNPS